MLKGLTQFYPLTRPFEKAGIQKSLYFLCKETVPQGQYCLRGACSYRLQQSEQSPFNPPVSLVFSVSRAACIPPLRNHLYLPRRQGLILSVLLLAAALGGVCHSDENMPEPGTWYASLVTAGLRCVMSRSPTPAMRHVIFAISRMAKLNARTCAGSTLTSSKLL